MTHSENDRNRMVDAALGEIDPRTEDDASYALAAAAIAAAQVGTAERLPSHLSARVAADAEAFFSHGDSSSKSTTAAGTQVIVMPAALPAAATIDYLRWGGWIAAAACFVIVVAQSFAFRSTRAASGRAPAEDAASVDAPAVDAPAVDRGVTDRISLHAADGVASTVSADVVWDVSRERGVIHVRGLAPSLPGEEYEAWIADRTQDGETLVPIGHVVVPNRSDLGAVVDMGVQAPIQIHAPARIEVTVERAGGVLSSPHPKVVLIGSFGNH